MLFRNFFCALALTASTSAFLVTPSTKSGVASQKPLQTSMPSLRMRDNDPEDWPDHPYNDYDDYDDGPPRMSSPDGRNPIGPYRRESSMSGYDYNDYTPRRSPPPRRAWNDNGGYREDYRGDYDREYRDERGFRDERGGYGKNTPPIGRQPRSDRHSNQFDDYTPRSSSLAPKPAVRTYYADGDPTFTPPVDNREPGGQRHANQFDDYSPRGSVPPSPPRRGEFDDGREYSRSVDYSRSGGDNRRNDRFDDGYDSRSGGSVPASASRNDRDYLYDDDRDYPDDRYNDERSRSRDRNDDRRDRRSDDKRDLYNERGSVPQSARGSTYDDDRSRPFDDRRDDRRDSYNESGSVPQSARDSTFDDNRRRSPNEYERNSSSRTSSPQYDSRGWKSGGGNRSSSSADNREPGGDWKTSRYGDYSTPTRSSAPASRMRANTDRPGTRPGQTSSLNNREPNGPQGESRKVWNANHNGRSPYSDHGLGNREPRGFRSTQPYRNYNSLPTKSSWNANRRGSASSADNREPGGQWQKSTYNDYSTPTRTGSREESTMRPRPQSRMTTPAELEDNSSLGSMRGSGSDANFDVGRRSSTGSRSRSAPRASAPPETRAPPPSRGFERRDGFGTSSARDASRTMPPPPAPAPRTMTPPAPRAMSPPPSTRDASRTMPPPPPPAPRTMTPPAPRAMSPPSAPVPSPSSTSSRTDRLGGPSTTMPPGGQSSAVGSAASYAEQMRATAPAESDNTGDGASDAYLAAMSGASSAPRPMPPPPPPAPVPSSSSRADRLGGPSTTLPSGGQSTATSSAESYAEQMRATAPAESDNTGDGASDAYLAAMSGAASMPQFSPPPPPPPPPPPAPIGRTERVKPSSTSTDSSTAAGADYLSAMGGGIPQKQPPKAAPKTATSGASINTDISTASGSDYLSAMAGGGAPPPDWSQAKASSPSPAPAAARAFSGDSSRNGVDDIRVWFQGVLGQDTDFASLDAYANRIVDLGVDSIELLLAALTQADVKDFDWMSEPDKQRLIERGGLKK